MNMMSMHALSTMCLVGNDVDNVDECFVYHVSGR